MPQYDGPRSDKSPPRNRRDNPYKEIGSIHGRWISIKSREVIKELLQIRVFSEDLEELGYRTSNMRQGVNRLLTRLCEDKKDNRYTQVLNIITKYLNGIHNFVSNTRIQGALSYRALVESVMVAIGYEIDCIDTRVA